jgi:hypothetical protein
MKGCRKNRPPADKSANTQRHAGAWADIKTERVVLLADRRDGKTLSATEGPLRVVVPDEKRQGRWVRQVITLTVRRAG